MTQNKLNFSSEQDRLPPQNIEAEEAILGGIMLDPEAIARVCDRLIPEAFYISSHKDIYQAALRLHTQSRPTDLLSVTSWLTDNGLLFRVGGRDKLATLIDRTVSAINIDALAELVMEKYHRRQLIKAANEILHLGYETETELPQIFDAAEEKVFSVTQQRSHDDLIHISDCLVDAYQEIESRYAGTSSPAISTGFYDLDGLLGGGFRPKRLYILAARPSVGKSALAGNLALNVAQSQRLPVAVFSLEMSREEYVQRFLSSESGIENSLLETGRLSNNQWQPLSQAVAQLSEQGIFINDNSCPTMNEIRSLVRKISATHGGVGLVIVDYLQLMSEGTDSRMNMTQRVGQISRGLKKLAKDLDVPVLALSQLSREVEHRNDKRPVLSDLRDCLTRNVYLTVASSGERISIADVQIGTKVLAVNQQQKVVAAQVQQVWAKGVKPVYQVTTQSGLVIECTDNHPILTQRGYVALKDLLQSDLVATAYRVLLQHQTDDYLKARLLGYLIGNGSIINAVSFVTPDQEIYEDFCSLVNTFFPGGTFNLDRSKDCWEVDVSYHYDNGYGKPFGNPLRNWLRSLGLTGKRSYEKFAPQWVFTLGEKGAAEFLAGLLLTDGCIKRRSDKWDVVFDTSSFQLAQNVSELLSRIGVAGTRSNPQKKKLEHHRLMYRVALARDGENLIHFASLMPDVGMKGRLLKQVLSDYLNCLPQPSGRSILALPLEISTLVREKTLHLRHQGIKHHDSTLRCWRDQGKRLNRRVCSQYAQFLNEPELQMWSNSDLLWESIRRVEYLGEHETFDICVPATGNFLANGVVVHNSGAVEQDSDVVIMLYRDEVHNPDSPDRGISELIVRKQRNGPTGTVKLLFDNQFTKFKNLVRHRQF